jgi:hypothetical protein
MSKYPELDKIHAVSDDSQKIGEFLEWLQSEGYSLGKYVEHEHDLDCWEWTNLGGRRMKQYVCGYSEGTNFVRIPLRINDLLAEYFGIDENKAEQERRAILNKLRNQ